MRRPLGAQGDLQLHRRRAVRRAGRRARGRGPSDPAAFAVRNRASTRFEQYLGTFQRTFGLSYTVLRYANIYGPRQDFFAEEGRVVAIFASRMLEDKPVTIDGDGDQSRDMLHVGDVAMANLAALERGDGGTFHVSSGIPVTVNDLFRKLAILTEYKREPMFGPARKGDVYRIALDNGRAAEQLGWEPRIQLEEGLRLTVEYFREQISRLHA